MTWLYLLAIPPLIFAIALGAKTIIDCCSDRGDEWWAFPLYMALVLPATGGGLILLILLLFLGLGVVRP